MAKKIYGGHNFHKTYDEIAKISLCSASVLDVTDTNARGHNIIDTTNLLAGSDISVLLVSL